VQSINSDHPPAKTHAVQAPSLFCGELTHVFMAGHSPVTFDFLNQDELHEKVFCIRVDLTKKYLLYQVRTLFPEASWADVFHFLKSPPSDHNACSLCVHRTFELIRLQFMYSGCIDWQLHNGAQAYQRIAFGKLPRSCEVEFQLPAGCDTQHASQSEQLACNQLNQYCTRAFGSAYCPVLSVGEMYGLLTLLLSL
jgi:hypothetical protein